VLINGKLEPLDPLQYVMSITQSLRDGGAGQCVEVKRDTGRMQVDHAAVPTVPSNSCLNLMNGLCKLS